MEWLPGQRAHRTPIERRERPPANFAGGLSRRSVSWYDDQGTTMFFVIELLSPPASVTLSVTAYVPAAVNL